MNKSNAKLFECLEVTLTINLACLRIVVIYRPTPSKQNDLSKAMFFDEFGDYLDNYVLSTGKIIVLGDFNFNWEDQADLDTLRLKHLFPSCCLSTTCYQCNSRVNSHTGSGSVTVF